ncbi:hypothetical protein GCM10022222_72400 [Amycolatopsis ultiminotia]|uniref:Uncharacterized protein n=1 Tax=Amycolatopsis ultiminotia TaxID=543629 RepID=A0ABP6Y660_9PSEU
MRWFALYARSRQLPVVVPAALLSIVAIRLLAASRWSPLFAALALTSAVALAAVGLSGQDVELDRTAAFGWLRRRFVHILTIGVVAGAVLLAVQSIGDSSVDTALIVRDSAGLLGLAGLAATVFGGQFGWTLPLVWTVLALSVPADKALLNQILIWPVSPPEDTLAWWLASGLFVLGTGLYSVVGARR